MAIAITTLTIVIPLNKNINKNKNLNNRKINENIKSYQYENILLVFEEIESNTNGK